LAKEEADRKAKEEAEFKEKRSIFKYLNKPSANS
jgi:hypothetical protein